MTEVEKEIDNFNNGMDEETDACEALFQDFRNNIMPYVKIAPSIGKLLNEMEVLIRQQNIDIPEVHLVINEKVKEIVEKARQENRKPSTNDLGTLVEDSNFLNTLHQGVNQWIKSICKVTKLEREPLSGTAIEETTFWFNMEQALTRLNEIRDSDEVQLTVDILKLGKRFQATISLDADTGNFFK